MTHDRLDLQDEVLSEAQRCARGFDVSPDIHAADHIFRFVAQVAPDKADAVRDFFNGGADAANWLKTMIGICRATDQPFTLLEFAAGYGRVTRHLPRALPMARIVASDIHPAAVEFIRTLGIKALLSTSDPDAFASPETYDVIFALSFFTHMPKSSWGRWLRALLSHLNPGGHLIFTTHGVPGMKVMGDAGRRTLPWDADGFWFEPMSEQQDIDAAEYGSTGTSLRFVQQEISASGASLFHFQERGAGYQDVYIVRPRDRADDLTVAPRRATRPRRAPPREVPEFGDCLFYHTMVLPSVGEVRGQWDLRGVEHDCLGGVDLTGRSVLEVGPASGYLTFWMERQGAKVTSFDLDEHEHWDLVPFAAPDGTLGEAAAQANAAHAYRGELIRKVNNAWWFARDAHGSSAACFNGTAYDIDETVGLFDVVTINSVLLHLRDPMLAVERAAARARQQIVITEVSERQYGGEAPNPADRACLHFIPRADAGGPTDAWWYIPSAMLKEMLRILGFRTIEIRDFKAKLSDGHDWDFYTIVGTR